MLYLQKYLAPASNGSTHIVSLCDDGTWQCDCIGWCRHYPRKNCKHIYWVIANKPDPLNKENWDKLKGKKRAVKAAVDKIMLIQQRENEYASHIQ